MRRWIASLILALVGCGSAQAEPDNGTVTIDPWSEAVVSVADFKPVEAFLVEVGRWRVVESGSADLTEYWFYGLPSSVRAKYRLLCAPQARDGCIRLVRYTGTSTQRPVRLAARPWDTGGLFSIMTRTDDLQALFDAAIKAGWWAESEPIRFQFGGSDLKNVVLTGPHGINIAVYERLTPPFNAFPVTPLSKGFNAMRMVRDQPAALRFYTQVLGFKTQFDADYLDPRPQASNFSIPHNLTTSIPRRAAVVFPVPGETGRIEVMQFTGLTGKDVSAYASPPNLGILALRYPVSDAPAYARLIEQRGGKLAFPLRTVRLAPYGRVALFGVRDPDGSITEFFQPLDK
jgi:catechol 2,3-dioxygenase-like lactoylglutathione lyase family enzyme